MSARGPAEGGDAAELAERLEALRRRLDEFRGRL